MIGDGIIGRPTQNLNHKQMSNNGCLDWIAMATCIEQLKLLALNSYGSLHYALNIACKLNIEQQWLLRY
jgi:hypothetical protein